MKKETAEIKYRKSKRSQLAVFVIIALLIVAVIGTFFFLRLKAASTGLSASEDPQGYIKKCARDSVQESADAIIPRGGFEEPSEYLLYDNEKVAWICYAERNEEICVNNHPMLTAEIEGEIKRMTEDRINSCFEEVKRKLSNYNYQEGEMNYSIEVLSGEVQIKIKKEISFMKNEQEVKIESFNTRINSPLYDFIAMANRIVNQEVSCNCGEEVCNADLLAINRYYRDYETTRFVSGKNEKVYSITEVISGIKFNFAVRNCVRLPL